MIPRKKVSKISILFNYSTLLVYGLYNLPTPGVFRACAGVRGYQKELTLTKRGVTFFTIAKKYGIIKEKGGMPFG